MSSHAQKQVPIVEVEAKSYENLRVSLGSFKESDTLKGFSVELTPENLKNKEDLVETKITMSGKVLDMQAYTLQLINKSNSAVCAEVWIL